MYGREAKSVHKTKANPQMITVFSRIYLFGTSLVPLWYLGIRGSKEDPSGLEWGD
jgi:hypothetical protein